MKPGTKITTGPAIVASMIPINRTYAPIQVLVDELARCGMEHAVTSPGSRNAPLALSLAPEPRIRAHSVLDERSAGSVAPGGAKQTGTPVAATCTSGPAAPTPTGPRQRPAAGAVRADPGGDGRRGLGGPARERALGRRP